MSARRVAAGTAAGIAGGAALIAAISVVARIVGFGRQLVFQYTVGQTVLGEIYATINALPNVVFEIVAGGALASVVVPLIATAASQGDTERVRRTVSALLGWTLIVLVPVAILGVLLAGPIAELMLRGRGGADGADVGRTMLLIFLPQVPLY
ncbi:lipid II flippase MurJ, partial [Phytoactinopolyspora endophytica]|uniref:lipid II flippase MurJ n=1 Tax=Phytoactinopolyspora endophytica TaxID=1642495 RepID=UPI00197C8868